MKLIYQGKQGEYIAGIPARDLTDEEVNRYALEWGYGQDAFIALLTRRGLYARETVTPATLMEEQPAPPKRTKKVRD